MWQAQRGGPPAGEDMAYHCKRPGAEPDWSTLVKVTFHEGIPGPELCRKLFYIRSVFRHDPDFTTAGLGHVGSVLEAKQTERLADTDATVADNYRRLVSASIAGLYSGAHDARTVAQLRELLMWEIRASMSRVFDDLQLAGFGNPLENGSFFFDKGSAKGFHYKALSSGEKAAFDLLLDAIIKRTEYDDTVYCVDGPEAHVHPALQARLLDELLHLLPETCQLWIATHAFGILRKAKDLREANPAAVAFLHFDGCDFDHACTMSPVTPDRAFWQTSQHAALADATALVGPKRVILCEARALATDSTHRRGLHAYCYRRIFAQELPEADFLSVDTGGNALSLSGPVVPLVEGLQFLRLVERDDRAAKDLSDAARSGARLLSRRNLEAFLLDDEILERLCLSLGKPDHVTQVIHAKRSAMQSAINQGKAWDDVKAAVPAFYTLVKGVLELTATPDDPAIFLRDVLAPLVTPDTKTYQALKADIFGPARPIPVSSSQAEAPSVT
jgi:hypothetical protein